MSDLLRTRLKKHLRELFDRHKVVVWVDESGTLGSVVGEVLPEGVQMPAFDGNPLSLRQEMDSDDPWAEKRWLLYVPSLPPGTRCEWLYDLQQGFHAVPQGTLSWALAQFFGVPETPALREALTGEPAKRLAHQFGTYLGSQRFTEGDVLFALLKAIIEVPKAENVDLVLDYLVRPERREVWKGAGLLAVLTAAIKNGLGLSRRLTEGQPPDEDTLYRCMVASALVVSDVADAKELANHLPQQEFRPRWQRMLETGLKSPDVHDALVEALRRSLVDSNLLATVTDAMRATQGPPLELLDEHIERLLLDARPQNDDSLPDWWQDVASVADERVKNLGDENPRWRSLAAAAKLLGRSKSRLQDFALGPRREFARLCAEYVDLQEGDWRLDAYYRELPQDDAVAGPEWETALIGPARQAYHAWVRELVTRFTKAIEHGDAYAAEGFLPHTQSWKHLVDQGERTAVLVLDAFRADLAMTLTKQLTKKGFDVTAHPVLAQLPARTEVGMAALLPGAHEGFAVRVEDGKLVSFIGDVALPGNTARDKYLDDYLAKRSKPFERRKTERFLEKKAEALKTFANQGALVFAETGELDDSGDIAARVDFALLDTILERCVRFVEAALQAGFSRVVLLGDHGFLVRDPDAAPGGVPGTAGSAASLYRGLRVAAGEGQVSNHLITVTASTLGRKGADVHVPRDSRCLAVQGGPGLFVHGGLSPQEVALVFLTVTRKRIARTGALLAVHLDVAESVDNLLFRVGLRCPGVETPLFTSPRRVRLRLLGPSNELVWQQENALDLAPSAADFVHGEMVKVTCSGRHTAVLIDEDDGETIESSSVQVNVLGGGWSF